MFTEAELNLLRVACLTAAKLSREKGHFEQVDAFHLLAEKCIAPEGGEAKDIRISFDR
jgi:hypothetical protein